MRSLSKIRREIYGVEKQQHALGRRYDKLPTELVASFGMSPEQAEAIWSSPNVDPNQLRQCIELNQESDMLIKRREGLEQELWIAVQLATEPPARNISAHSPKLETVFMKKLEPAEKSLKNALRGWKSRYRYEVPGVVTASNIQGPRYFSLAKIGKVVRNAERIAPASLDVAFGSLAELFFEFARVSLDSMNFSWFPQWRTCTEGQAIGELDHCKQALFSKIQKSWKRETENIAGDIADGWLDHLKARIERDLVAQRYLLIRRFAELRQPSLVYQGEQSVGGSMNTRRAPKPHAELPQKKKRDLSQFFEGLTDKQHECISLRLEYGLSVAEIARRLGRHPKTVSEHIQAATARIDSNRAKTGRTAQIAKKKTWWS